MAAVALVAAACSSSGEVGDVPPLPETTAADIEALLASSAEPVLLNVWGSWCVPCRSEAPLLAAAHDEFGDEIRFIGVDIRDTQTGARSFINEFDLDFEHFFDPGGAVPAALGGRGVPMTFFYGPGGELVRLHNGVIDERMLALQIDELQER